MELNAGDFERSFSDFLSAKISNENRLTPELVEQCYEEVRVTFGLKVLPSDELRIKDIYASLQDMEASQPTSKEIFNVIFNK